MTATASKTWENDFGIDRNSRPNFFCGTDDLNKSVRQAHVLRHAFELLELDGIICADNTPLIYFKLVDEIETETVLRLHRQFWNHGGAPILVLVSEKEVQVHSGMSRPVPRGEIQRTPPSLVKTLDRVSDTLQEFLLSVETGDFFRQNAPSFNPDHRVDHDLLDNLRDARKLLGENTQTRISSSVLDALLCRLVFTCYLFDRHVIGENYLVELGYSEHQHLRDILSIQPVRDAKTALYKLFEKLGEDFNGDLFSDELEAESRKITQRHIQILSDFFHGTSVNEGQLSFWPYDFRFIPIETISAIYEHFLKDEDQQKGAFYTPRFLAEIVLDMALQDTRTLIGKKFLDPACGSGIFLVGLFNRIAEEWRQANPNARNDQRAKELIKLMQNSLFGVDINPTACRITAFSLYLAYLDQLAPRDIRKLQKKGRALPHLVIQAVNENVITDGNIRCGDFFEDPSIWDKLKGTFEDIDLVIGNPPWGSIAKKGTPAADWCKEHQRPIPDNQIATAFVWKAATHVSDKGHLCLVLPHGVLTNHGNKAKEFQNNWIKEHTIDQILNLADLRKFLFNEARHPAIVVKYRSSKPDNLNHRIAYWAPKADWITTQAEIIPVSPLDRHDIALTELEADLKTIDGPQLWTQTFWGSERDRRLINRLSLFPRIRNHVQNYRDKNSDKPWYMAEGFQPFGNNDPESTRRSLNLPSRRFLPATSSAIDLFVVPRDCDTLPSSQIDVRRRIQNTAIFEAPHVIITKGFKRIAYADFDVSFQRSVGVQGPKTDRNLLMFLAAYLRTPLARYFAFHTSHKWSMFHEEVQVNELMRLPFPLPKQTSNPKRSLAIVDKVASIIDQATRRAETDFMQRQNAVEEASAAIEPLIYDYFSIQPLERILIADTANVLIPSIQPSQNKMPVPTVKHASSNEQNAYKDLLCEMLNKWAKRSSSAVRGAILRSDSLGVGLSILEKSDQSSIDKPIAELEKNILQALDRVRNAIPRKMRTIDPVRGIMVFDKNRLYIVKPLALRYWTKTSALNDADEIAGFLLMPSTEKGLA